MELPTMEYIRTTVSIAVQALRGFSILEVRDAVKEEFLIGAEIVIEELERRQLSPNTGERDDN